MTSLAKEFRLLSVSKGNAAVSGSSGGIFAFNFAESAEELPPVHASHIINNSSALAEDDAAKDIISMKKEPGAKKKAKKAKNKSKSKQVSSDNNSTANTAAVECTAGIHKPKPSEVTGSDDHLSLKMTVGSKEIDLNDLRFSEVVEEKLVDSAPKSKNKSGSSKKKKKKTVLLQQESSVTASAPAPRKVSAPPPGLESVDPIYAPGPIVLSHKDPELSEEQKQIRRFGYGINVSAIGPRKNSMHKDPNWVQHLAHKVVLVGEDDESLLATASSPFSFGFGL